MRGIELGDVGNILIGAAEIRIDGKPLGFTTGGVSIRKKVDKLPQKCGETIGIVGMRQIDEMYFIETTIAEMTMENLKLLWDLREDIVIASDTKKIGFGGDLKAQRHSLLLIGEAPESREGNERHRQIKAYGCYVYSVDEYPARKDGISAIGATFALAADITKPEGQQLGEIFDGELVEYIVSWDNVGGGGKAITYRLQVALDNKFEDMIYDKDEISEEEGSITSWTVRLIKPVPPMIYYRRVRSFDGAIYSPWSDVVAFTL